MNDERPTVTDTRLTCPTCEYNLTGLTSGRCPECGTAVDLEALRTAAARGPIGTPVYRSRGWRLFPDTLRTLLLMLFRPWEFAKRLRVDEPFAPAACVFLLAIFLHPTVTMIWFVPWPRFAICLLYCAIYLGMLAGCVGVLAVPLTILSLHCHPSFRRFRLALRFWFIVAMYTMVFAIFWPWLWAETRGLGWRAFTVDWPFFSPRSRLQDYRIATVLIWWTLILAAVLWRRVRSRWLAILLIPLAFLFVRLTVQAADAFILRLAR